MSRCLGEKALWAVHEGEGSQKERAHARNCARCAARLQQLGGDLRVLSQVLCEAPPVPASAPVRRPLVWRWVAFAAVAGAASLALLWNGALTLDPSARKAPQAAFMRQEEAVDILEKEVYSALFTNVDLDMIALPARVSTLTYVQAALDGGWPCEPATLLKRATCDQRPFFLLFEDQ